MKKQYKTPTAEVYEVNASGFIASGVIKCYRHNLTVEVITNGIITYDSQGQFGLATHPGINGCFSDWLAPNG